MLRGEKTLETLSNFKRVPTEDSTFSTCYSFPSRGNVCLANVSPNAFLIYMNITYRKVALFGPLENDLYAVDKSDAEITR